MAGRIVPIILCGGGGTRLWPASTGGRPKPFLPLLDRTTTFAATLDRVGDADLFAPPVIVANRRHRALVAAALAEAEVAATVLLEPEARDTAPAIAAASAFVAARDPGAILLVLAADHMVRDVGGFRATVRAALPAAEAGRIVVFGIPPAAPHTGFGYIRPGNPLAGMAEIREVAAFVEKPDEAKARAYIAAGYLWNSGNFMLSAATAAAEFTAHAPGLAAAAARAVAAATAADGTFDLAEGPFAEAERISFDHAVMEKTHRAAVVEAAFDWSDLGTWSAVWEAATRDADGNAVEGDAVLLDAHRNYVSTDRQLVGILGLDDIVVVASEAAMLVAPRGRADQLKDLVAAIGRRRRAGAADARIPFGAGEGHRVSRVTVGAASRFAETAGRAGRWTVAEGRGEAETAAGRTGLSPGVSILVGPGDAIALDNPGPGPLVAIVVEWDAPA